MLDIADEKDVRMAAEDYILWAPDDVLKGRPIYFPQLDRTATTFDELVGITIDLQEMIPFPEGPY